MKKFLLFISLTIVLTSCTYWEESKTTELLRPGAAISVGAYDDAMIFVFDSGDTLAFVERFSAGEVIDSLPVVDAVPEGKYRVVSFLNCGRYYFEPMEVGKSSYRDLQCELVDFKDEMGNPISSIDSILYGNQMIDATWGWGSRVPVEIVARELYYNVGLRLRIEDGYNFWGQVSQFSLELRRLPRLFDWAGVGSRPSVTFSVSEFEQDDPSGVISRVRVPRFSDGERVELHAVSNGYSLGYVTLLPSAFGVRPDTVGSASFVVDLAIKPRSINISVEDWQAGTIQWTTIGG